MFTKWCRAFPGLPDQVAEARHFVAALLQERGVADDAVLVVSELATNAVRHTLSGSAGGWFLVVVAFRADGVRLEVVDQGGDNVPEMCDVVSQDNGGRGLWLVSACAKDWGVKDVPSGRTVWADLVGDGA
ncbi:ATP-binding protein [Streptomyces caniscabiei]|uniref:ATP-binding protein n=1 Tax=Streptomyces caniscabiei TaxID=2746961 RepID=A0A927L6N2_9ACTN|nr:ATP-binding protein [Streptomyces caniscabiei]MBD9725796.1 ATP-binding protein [Streptomyces caniscabiei]MDX3507506.1 ATP-binding protein [Streptomyces caniscabiei]MDX3717468.1 ATP-binding protein [Streptomyces caniscabiei]WEO25225.1 ATP-binding protein [Streptomyces caniscabiei]